MQVDLLRKLEEEEPRARLHTLAFMSFNASIGWVLEAGSVATFTEMLDKRLPHLSRVASQEDFDEFHHEFLQEFMSTVKRAKDRQPLVYGQAQKPLNVFLKVFVHWASLRSQEVAEKIRPLLHVPLDSILMQQVKDLFREECDEIVRPAYGLRAPSTQLRLVNPDTYLAWQRCFRAICPDMPVLLDVLWFRGRSGGRASRKKSTGGGS